MVRYTLCVYIILLLSNSYPTSTPTQCYYSGEDNEDDEDDEDDELDADSFLSPTEKMKRNRRRKAKRPHARVAKSTSEKASDVVETYFKMEFNPEHELKAQHMRMNNIQDATKMDWSELDVDWARVRDNDTLYISSIFDLREWWLSKRRNGQYQLIYPVVPVVLALPSANGFQERTFSGCTVFDSPLRQRMKPKRFEMAVLLAKNDDGLKKMKTVSSDVEEAKDIGE